MQLFFIFKLILILSLSTTTIGKEIWILDKELSTIKFELPILFANNVKGEFRKIDGLIEIDTNNKENNKAIFSVETHSVNMNYKKYKDLLLSEIFFDSKKNPLALVDTKKFSYKNESEITLEIELTIKGISKIVPLQLTINHLAEDLVQIKGKLFFLRSSFNVGTGKWSSTAILRDKAIIETDIFLFKE